MSYRIAAPYKRFIAAIIDIIIIIPLTTVAILIINYILNLPVTPNFSIYGFEIDMNEWAQEHFWEVVLLYSFVKLIVLAVYFIPFETSLWQGTPGKRLLNIQVTDQYGNRIKLKRSIIRFFSKIISAQLAIGYIMILLTKNNQGLHDLISKTRVVEK